jgi:hypothetical protein
MTCYECQGRPGPGGLTYDDRTAVGVCRRCGKGLCKHHGAWSEATNEFLCSHCATRPAGPRSREE